MSVPTKKLLDASIYFSDLNDENVGRMLDATMNAVPYRRNSSGVNDSGIVIKTVFDLSGSQETILKLLLKNRENYYEMD